jgi:hypothetical protein
MNPTPLPFGGTEPARIAFGWGRALRALLLLVVVVGLLHRIADVAQRSVAQARARQAAQSLQAEAQWRCQALRPAAARQRCQTELREHPPADAAALRALLAEAAS